MKAIYRASLVPGEETLACERHAQAIKNISDVLGTYPLIVPYTGEEECENCKNEAKSAV